MPPRGTRKAAKPPAELQSTSNKRDLEEEPELLTPRRQSKRIKSTEQLRDTPASPQPKLPRAQPKSESRLVQEETIKVQNQPGNYTATTKGKLEEEVEQDSIKVKDEVDDEATVTTKTPKKRKTKKEQQAEIMPLRARTQGLRMHVGAHVSAAGGKIPCLVLCSRFGPRLSLLIL